MRSTVPQARGLTGALRVSMHPKLLQQAVGGSVCTLNNYMNPCICECIFNHALYALYQWASTTSNVWEVRSWWPKPLLWYQIILHMWCMLDWKLTLNHSENKSCDERYDCNGGKKYPALENREIHYLTTDIKPPFSLHLPHDSPQNWRQWTECKTVESPGGWQTFLSLQFSVTKQQCRMVQILAKAAAIIPC